MAEMVLPDIDLEGRGLAAEVQRLSYSILHDIDIAIVIGTAKANTDNSSFRLDPSLTPWLARRAGHLFPTSVRGF